MNDAGQAASDAIRVRWSVPDLIERPAVGTSCCASTAEAIIAQELSLLPGILDLAIDPPAGLLELAYDPSQVSERAIREALEEIGYGAE